MSDALRKFNGQPLRKCLRRESSRWKCFPTATQWRNDYLPLCRAPSFFSCMRYNYDWYFEQNDEGAVTVQIDGSYNAKKNFVFGLGSEMSDSQGYYVVLSDSGARIYRSSSGSIYAGQGYGETGYVEIAGEHLTSVAEPSQHQKWQYEINKIALTFIYDHGHFKLVAGDDPNNAEAQVLVEFIDPKPIMGCRKYGFGLFGKGVGGGCYDDEVKICDVQKWSR